jgi:HEAT repeat protein
MTFLQFILYAALAMAAIGAIAILIWFGYTAYLNRLERRLAARKGPYRDLVAGLASRERELLEPAIRQLGSLRDLEALEAVLEEQARDVEDRPAWLLDAYDRLGLISKYIERLQHARRWRERAFAAELLGRVGNASAVPALLETVQNTRTEDADVREIALRALARIADPRAVAPLVEALRNAEVWLAPRMADILTRHGEHVVQPMISFLEEGGRHHARAWAANILGDVHAHRAFPVLVRSLGDLEDEVRAKSAYALGRLGDRRATPYLLEHLLTDPAPFVRARIAGALGQFDDPEVIERLVRSLGDPAWWVRMRSVEALEQIGDQAEGPLLVALDDPDPELRIRSAVALERLGVPARTVRMIEENDRPEEAREILTKFAAAGARELLAELLLHPSSAVRLAVVAAIRRTGRRDLARELIQAAADTDPTVRAAAFDTLRSLGQREAVPAALAGMADSDEAVRTEAIHLLGDLGGPAITMDLRNMASDPEVAVRAAVARALGLVGATDASAEISRLLTDPAASVRHAAAEAAATAGLAALVPELVDRLSDSDERVRAAAAEALGRLGDESVVPPLVRAFSGASAELRQAITSAVAALDPERLRDLHAALIEEKASPEIRLGFARALADAPSPAADAALSQFARDPEPALRAAAVAILGRHRSPDAAALASEGLDDPDETVRAGALTATIRLGDTSRADRIITMLAHDPADSVRERAALAAGILGLESARPELARACSGATPVPVRAASVLALGALGDETVAGRVAAMPDDDAVRELLQVRLRDDAEYRLLGMRLRQSHSLELRALASLTRTQMEQELAEGMRSVLDPAERRRVVAGLSAFQGDRSRSTLLQAVRGDPSPDVRAAALEAVAGMLDAEELGVIARRALGDPNLAVRRTAVTLFEHLPAGEALPALLATVRADDDPSVLRHVAARAQEGWDSFMDLALGSGASGREAVVVTQVARYIDHPALHRLMPPLARSAEPAVREGLARLLTARTELATEALVQGLISDPVTAVRLAAAHAAAAAGFEVPIAALADDPDADVRRELAMLLRAVPGQGTLARLLADTDPRVRAAAAVTAISRGELTALPEDVAPAEAAGAVMDANHLAELRSAARTSPDERHRLAAALLLALVRDQVAREVEESDPVPAVRAAVHAMRERCR